MASAIWPERRSSSAADYALLADTTGAIAQRLDAVIGQLDRVLEG